MKRMVAVQDLHVGSQLIPAGQSFFASDLDHDYYAERNQARLATDEDQYQERPVPGTIPAGQEGEAEDGSKKPDDEQGDGEAKPNDERVAVQDQMNDEVISNRAVVTEQTTPETPRRGLRRSRRPDDSPAENPE
jgi:hypothetical protein